MEIELPPDLEMLVERKVKTGQYRDASEYIGELLQRELRPDWRRRLEDKVAALPGDWKDRLAEGYAERAEEDRRLAEDWFPLEEELYDHDPPRGS